MTGRMIPAGLSLAERAHLTGDGSCWDIVHTESRLEVVRGCLTQREAIDFAVGLSAIDWDRSADELRADLVAAATARAVQAECSKPRRKS